MKMTHERPSTPAKKKLVPGWIRTTTLWKFMSDLKLALKRMTLSMPYRDRGRSLHALRYFMAVEGASSRHTFVQPFRFKGISFSLRPMEWHLMQAILLEEEYGGPVARLFEERPPAVIVDAGANVGMFSVYALSKWHSVKILAVEPAPETFKLLEQNQKKNPDLNWVALQYAFWKDDGVISFESEEISMASHITADANSIQVPAIRLDHFIEKYLQPDERVSLLKMDIEGAEEASLFSARATLHRVDAIVIEIHPKICDEAVVRLLLKQEFDVVEELSAPSTEYPVLLAYRSASV